MANLKKQLFQKENLLVIFLLLLANVGWFWKFYFQNLLPFPGDLLVSFFFPWNSGGFIGFDQWTTHKDVIAADVIRQMYPWKQFAFELIKHGQFPLWNPFNFSGYPLIANLQSSVFFPGNLLFLFLPTLWAWIGNVVYLPLIMSLFTYLFLRSLKLSRLAACFGAIVSINLGYIVVWHEQLIITQVAMFLPASLWTVNLYLNSKKPIYLLLTSLFLAFAIFGGHAQTFIYLLIILTAYMWLVKIPRIYLLALILFSFALGAVQLFPTMEIYLHSAREGQATRELFAPFILPWQNLATILAPDFFGSPATNNFWGKQYGDFQVYFGVVAAIFSLIGAVNLFKDRVVKLFILLGFAGLLFAVYPLVYLPHVLNIPILATGVPARIIFIFQFASMVLAAYGFDFIARSEKKVKLKLVLPIFIIALGYFVLWASVVLIKTPEMNIARNNLILPSATFFAFMVLFVLALKLGRRYLQAILCLIVALAIFEYSYLFNKYQPFAPAKFVFPNHRVIKFLQKDAGINRYFGFGTAYVDSNFATQFKIFAPEGWDSLYIKRYGELLASTADGQLPQKVRRSDALFGTADNFYRNRLFDLLGVKYILDKNDNPQSSWEEEPGKFSPDHYHLVWQSYKWKAYERLTAMPRVFLANNFEVIKSDSQIISRFYESGFDYRNTLILEQDPNIHPTKVAIKDIKILSYEPNKIVIKTQADGPQLLFLSDTFFPGWQASIDGKDAPVYRADYIFRAVALKEGSHKVIFTYQPWPFTLGLYLSLGSFALFVVLMIFLRKKHDHY